MSRRLNSGGRMVRAGRNAKEILIPKISVTGLGDYTRNVGYKTGSITYEYKTHSFGYDRAIRLLPDVVDVEESGVLAALRAVISDMDERQVSTGSRYLFITPTLRGVLDDFSLANPPRSNCVLERFSRIVEVPQVRFYTAIDLKSGDTEFGYAKASTGKDINFMVVERSAVIKFDKHVASRVFSPDELENLDSYMMKYRKYGIVELLDNKLDGVHVSCAPLA